MSDWSDEVESWLAKKYTDRTAEKDQGYQKPKHYIYNGFPNHRQDLPDQCKQYWSVHTHLSIEDDLIVYGCQLVLPTEMRREVLKQLHAAHQGIVRTKERAILTLYWPGMDNDIENVISSCKTCQDTLPSNPREPIAMKPLPTRPFQEIAGDLSFWLTASLTGPTLYPWTTTPQLTAALKASFCRSGVPDIFWSDQGPQFTSRTLRSNEASSTSRHILRATAKQTLPSIP